MSRRARSPFESPIDDGWSARRRDREQPSQDGPSTSDRATAFVDSLIGVVFLGVAVWFLLGDALPEIPLPEQEVVSRDRIAPGAPRDSIGDPPSTVIGGYSHNCNDCHRLFDSPPAPEGARVQHAAIRLNHGLNARCYNCHSERDRERLALVDGTLVTFADTPRLCAQCHGTVYRDWTQGTHGKTLGSWDAASGRQRRLRCNECHDPHAPAYQPIAPLPGPNELRVGEQEPKHEEESHRHEPLSRPKPAAEPRGEHNEEAPR